MGVELPMISAVLAEMPDSLHQLAANAGIVYPVSLIIEAPIIMLLSASTALCADRKTERWLWRFTFAAVAVVTVVHALVACTPLYDLTVGQLMDVKPNVLEAGRIGLMMAIPWPGAIAWRRYRQGILIAQGHSRVVGQGTIVRLAADCCVLGVGLALANWLPEWAPPGAMLAGAVLGVGTIAEAVYIELLARPVVRRDLSEDRDDVPALTLRSFSAFYIPLALTPLMTLSMQPMGSATMSKMPSSADSLAGWGAVYGLIFILRSPGFAFQEVVVSLERHWGGHARAALHRAALYVAVVVTAIALLLSIGPTGTFWFSHVARLEDGLVALCLQGMAIGFMAPALAVLLHLQQGRLVAERRTREVTFGVVVYFLVAALGLFLGVQTQLVAGMPWTIAVFLIAGTSQVVWLGWRVRAIQARDAVLRPGRM